MKPINVLAQQIDRVEEYIATTWPVALSQARSLRSFNRKITQILIGGCGESHHAAMGLELAFGVYTGKPTRALDAMHLARYAPNLVGAQPESKLVIGISASGEVARTIEALEIWSEAGAQTLAFTTNIDSTLARVAQGSLILPAPDIPHGPGLLSYIGSLLLGYATIATMLEGMEQQRIIDLIAMMPELLREWVMTERIRSERFAQKVSQGVTVFLGSGAAHGSAHFAAAKVIEAAGERCWAQDVEEWAHLEYFCEPDEMPTVLLSSEGRSLSRELELLEAMAVLGRMVHLSKWQGGSGWSALEREMVSPLALWAGPCVYASTRATILGEKPFRDFRGGRDRKEGGGPSRIRSSQRVDMGALDQPDEGP